MVYLRIILLAFSEVAEGFAFAVYSTPVESCNESSAPLPPISLPACRCFRFGSLFYYYDCDVDIGNWSYHICSENPRLRAFIKEFFVCHLINGTANTFHRSKYRMESVAAATYLLARALYMDRCGRRYLVFVVIHVFTRISTARKVARNSSPLGNMFLRARQPTRSIQYKNQGVLLAFAASAFFAWCGVPLCWLDPFGAAAS